MTGSEENLFDALRRDMLVQITLHATIVADKISKSELEGRVLAVMGKVPRHQFVPPDLQSYAYLDAPLPIGYGKTISQPFIAALMTDLLDVQPGDSVLEVGTGLGYHSAVLAELAGRVFTVEIVEELADGARRRLRDSDYDNVELRIGDGAQGWHEHAPFDKVLVTAAPELIPVALLHQVKPGGRIVSPAGIESSQTLMLLKKDERGRIASSDILPVRFAPLVTTH